jgi:hypothetical protein
MEAHEYLSFYNAAHKHAPPSSAGTASGTGTAGGGGGAGTAGRSLPDAVNHPNHYGGDTVYEVIKVIEAWKLGFNLGNTVKYIGRPGKGNYLEDLKKASWYLLREINRLEREISNMEEDQ